MSVPLPPSKGYTYLLTCINRFTCWPEAIPIVDITADKQLLKLLWVDGSPDLVSHQLLQLTKDVSLSLNSGRLMQLLESKQVHTTAYHPIANGLIEQFHHQLKTSLKSQPNPTHWMEILSQFRRVTCLSSRLNALVASTKISASMSSPAKRCSIAWTAASHPASCPR